MLLRILQVMVAAATVAVAAIAYGSEPLGTDVLTVAAPDGSTPATVPTTAPVGLPLEPTPTPIGIPAAPTPPPSPEPAAATTATSAPVATPLPTAVASQPPPDTAGGPEASAPPSADEPPAPTPTTVLEPPDPEPTETPAAPIERIVTDVGYRPLGQASGIPLVLPVGRIELIGFHEAGHPGSQAINAAGTGVRMLTLESRGRGTSAWSAADIVVPPDEPVVAPVTGTIVAANPYILYCVHDDQLLYIEPDGLPGWEVRLFHIEGASPPVGSRVVAGETVVAASARTLPFESQVDEHTAEPSWPHVHVEVVDTSVPDTRPPGPGCP